MRTGRKKKHVFEALDVMEEGLDSYRQDNPVFVAEFQGSWFDSWKGFGYDKIRRMLGVEQIDVATKSALFQRATLINYFMFSGGTTWGYLGSPDVYTSYDMASPISEWGEITARGEAVRKIIKDTAELGTEFLETDIDESVRCMTTGIYYRARKAKDGTRYVLLRNMTNKRKNCKIKGVDEKVVLDNAQACIVVLDDDGTITKKIEPYTDITDPEKHEKHDGFPELENWKLSWGSPQIIDKYDASGWRLLTEEPAWDFDSLGHHYGYGWYRGTFRGRLKKIEVDARHCLSVYMNGKLVESKDNFRNTTGVGDDVAQTFEIYLPRGFQHGDMNVITILVESLGHNKDFECDVKNPRGIVSLKCYGAKVVWRFRGGLLDGEKGLTPVLPKKDFAQYEPKGSVELPHFWEPYEEGIGLYETNVTLNVKNPGETPVGLVIPEAHSKANIYVNGYLIGRYWKEMGPQNKFFIPWGILKPRGKNHIAIAVWKRWEAGCLGKVRIEQY